MTPMQAAVEGTREIGLAVMATTLSLLAVFVPVGFMGGTVGASCRPSGSPPRRRSRSVSVGLVHPDADARGASCCDQAARSRPRSSWPGGSRARPRKAATTQSSRPASTAASTRIYSRTSRVVDGASRRDRRVASVRDGIDGAAVPALGAQFRAARRRGAIPDHGAHRRSARASRRPLARRPHRPRPAREGARRDATRWRWAGGGGGPNQPNARHRARAAGAAQERDFSQQELMAQAREIVDALPSGRGHRDPGLRRLRWRTRRWRIAHAVRARRPRPEPSRRIHRARRSTRCARTGDRRGGSQLSTGQARGRGGDRPRSRRRPGHPGSRRRAHRQRLDGRSAGDHVQRGERPIRRRAQGPGAFPALGGNIGRRQGAHR